MKLLTLRKLHKWVALFVGLQIVLWSLSGLMFAWLDHHAVKGHDLVRKPPATALPADEPVLDPETLLEGVVGADVTEVRLVEISGQWVYRVAGPGETRLFRASDGTPFAIDRDLATELAQSYYSGDGPIVAIVHHAGPTLETRKAGPSWEAQFGDDHDTSVYISAEDGSLIVARSATWRLFDFFWMLHTMDYVGRDNFNNPLVILAASAGVWISLTGLLLVIRLYRPRVKSSGNPARA